MIVRRLQLHPFAAATQREIFFESGLNIILGPNEAGKTTLRNALRMALFVSTKLNKRERAEEVARHLPLGGGDTIRVSVDMESAGRTWKVVKQWSDGGSAAELQLPDGGVIADVAAVDERLRDLLVLSRGTWEHVLFADQGQVDSALDQIGGGDASEDLNEVLRRAVFETDGVSIEELGSAIETRWNLLFGHWDRELGRPEGNRGVEKPWKRGTGRILAAYYCREQARCALDKAECYYRDLDEITGRVDAAASECEALAKWVDTNKQVAADTEKRVVLEGQMAGLRTKEKELREISQKWPVEAAKIAQLGKTVNDCDARMNALAAERKQAESWEGVSRKRELLDAASKLTTVIEEARKDLAAMPKVEAGQIDQFEKLDRECVQIRARLEAAKLSITFQTRQPIDIEYQAGMEAGEKQSLAEGDSLEFTAAARAVIRHADWELEARSAEVDVAAEETRHGELKQKSVKLLKEIGAKDLADARTRRGDRLKKEQDLNSLKKRLEELLGERVIDELRSEVESAGADRPKRSTAEVADEQGKKAGALEEAKNQLAETTKRLAAWKAEYGSPDALLDQLIDERAALKKLKADLAALRPLPENVRDPGQFLDEFRRKAGELDLKKNALNGLLVDKAGLEARAPAEEPSEAAEELAMAEIDFEAACKEGAAIERIRNQFEALRTELDNNTLDPWLGHLSEVVAPLTGDRYRAIDPASSSSAREDAVKVPFDVLSTGTRACLGLAVRLSMCRWFLEDSDGFLLLDDPFVDLDPQRQEAAARVLQNFAAEKQVILLTCHPLHAELLDGNLIEL